MQLFYSSMYYATYAEGSPIRFLTIDTENMNTTEQLPQTLQYKMSDTYIRHLMNIHFETNVISKHYRKIRKGFLFLLC